MEEKLRRLGARLDELLVRAEQTRDYAAKINVNELRRQKDSVEKELKALRFPARRAWNDIQAGLEEAWEEVKKAFSRAKDEFKK